MARNEEKAQSTLNRYLAAKVEEERGPKQKRPFLATECRDLNEADKWRQQILREIGKKVMEIQNAALGEHRIRDLNDEINKLIREKGHWERRIVELGGPDYSKSAPKVADSRGREVAEMTGKGTGYRYFGAAKALPGVKELFEVEPPKQVRKTRYQMHKAIDPDYYGFRDEEDGVLEKVEGEAEEKMRMQAVLDWEAEEIERQKSVSTSKAKHAETEEADGVAGARFVAYVPLPDQKAIEQLVLEKKKADLLAKYTSESLVKEQEEAKSLLNVRH
uniref:Pre-mRNA-splicing factor ISY1 n=1 Tax=Dunaliella tertiolecta TaxID=3047 RepID=A0A7S3QV93_DUNTE|mmetsp:Transcript_13202/g.35915  ORF Transcript_13202/g.35915 Transcript_13202/m.35915 type:complete len:275 (-) Transcript_13202:205-1029(-)